MSRVSKRLFPCLLLVVLLFTSGCWDRVEIEQRGFVVGTAIDLLKHADHRNKPLYRVTYQIIIPAGYDGTGGKSSSSGAMKAYHNVTAEGETLFDSTRELAAKMSRTPFMENNQLIIVSESVARSGHLSDVLDLYMRDPESRRSTKMMVAKGDAKTLLAANAPSEKFPVAYISSVAENAFKNFEIYPVVSIGKLQEQLLSGRSFVLPEIRKVKADGIKMTGVGVFNGKNDKMVGFLNESETKGLRLLRGNAKDGLIRISMQGKTLIFEVKRADRHLKVDLTHPHSPIFTFFITVEGNLGETHLHQNHVSEKRLTEMERKTALRIKQLARATIQKSQKSYHTDTLGLAEFLRKNNFHTWKKINANWDQGENIFEKSTIRVKVKAKITKIGIMNRTSR